MIRRITLLIGFSLLLVLTGLGMVVAQNAGSNNPTQLTVSNTVTAKNVVTTTVAVADELLPLSDLPPYILLVGQRAAPGAKFTGFRWALDDAGKPVYKLEGTDKEQKLQMSIFLDGTIAKIIRNITMSDVPTDVTGLLDKYVPDAKVTNVNLAEGGNSLKRYEFQGMLNGIVLNIEIASSANEIKITESARQ
ncbi:MAG: hypothetical protein U0350_47350 [Caldilineaceae bacterium]